MARNQVHVDAAPEEVFDALLDASNYPQWVVGAKRIRHVEPEWPAVGSGFHHTVGLGPAVLHDETRIVTVDRPSLLVLDARARPSGRAEVRFHICPADEGGTELVMEEDPVSGPAAWIPRFALDPIIDRRNRRTLRLLRELIEERASD